MPLELTVEHQEDIGYAKTRGRGPWAEVSRSEQVQSVRGGEAGAQVLQRLGTSHGALVTQDAL